MEKCANGQNIVGANSLLYHTYIASGKVVQGYIYQSYVESVYF